MQSNSNSVVVLVAEDGEAHLYESGVHMSSYIPAIESEDEAEQLHALATKLARFNNTDVQVRHVTDAQLSAVFEGSDVNLFKLHDHWDKIQEVCNIVGVSASVEEVEEVAQSLIAGASDEIWYDADDYGDTEAATRISATQDAMVRAADLLRQAHKQLAKQQAVLDAAARVVAVFGALDVEGMIEGFSEFDTEEPPLAGLLIALHENGVKWGNNDAKEYENVMFYRSIAPGIKVRWNDPDGGVSNGIYTVTGVHSDSGKVYSGTEMVYLKNDAGSNAQTLALELSPAGKGVMLVVEPEEEALAETHFDCWSESGDETTEQFDWEDTRAISIAWGLFEQWSKALNVSAIHPSKLRGGETFDHWYLTQGQHPEGYSNAFRVVADKLIDAGYSVYMSDTRIEIYKQE